MPAHQVACCCPPPHPQGDVFLQELCTACCAQQPEDRPSFLEIVAAMEAQSAGQGQGQGQQQHVQVIEQPMVASEAGPPQQQPA